MTNRTRKIVHNNEEYIKEKKRRIIRNKININKQYIFVMLVYSLILLYILFYNKEEYFSASLSIFSMVITSIFEYNEWRVYKGKKTLDLYVIIFISICILWGATFLLKNINIKEGISNIITIITIIGYTFSIFMRCHRRLKKEYKEVK